MEIDKKALDAALSGSPERLAQIARTVAGVLGLPEQQVLGAVQNAPMLRAKLNTISEKDLARAADMLGEEKAKKIIAAFEKNDG